MIILFVECVIEVGRSYYKDCLWKANEEEVSPSNAIQLEITFNLYVENLSYKVKAKDLRNSFTSEGTDIVNAEVVFEEYKKEAEAAPCYFPWQVVSGKKNLCGT
ncbi:hypothetical protein ACLB2K_073283 [Fragaria x ananassa]